MMTYRRSFNRTWLVLIIGSAMLMVWSSALRGGTWVPSVTGVASPGGDNVKARSAAVQVEGYDDTGLDVTVRLPGVELSAVEKESGSFVEVRCPKSELSNREGFPSLPVIRRLICVPDGASVELFVEEGAAQEIDLSSAGLPTAVVPFQPLEDLQGGADSTAGLPAKAAAGTVFRMDPAAYGVDGAVPAERAAVSRSGVMRRVQLYELEVRPVAYNAAKGVLTVWSDLRVRVRFTGGARGYAGVRSSTALRGSVLNPPAMTFEARDSGNYLIVASSIFSGSAPLTQFVAAKTAQGFAVTTYVVPVGTDRSAIKSYIESQWNSPTPPDYLLIIGDANMYETASGSDTIPIYPGVGSYASYTDLPYVCMDAGDDWFADMALGRWPVRTVSELQSVVDKTLYVEGGSYSDPTYTKRAMFMASPDPEAGNDAINNEIIATYMVPNGIETKTVYYDLPHYGQGTQDVADGFNAGCFLAVYWGHSGVQQWNAPAFTFSDIDALTNTNKYPLVVSFSCNPSAFPQVDYEPILHEKFFRAGGKAASATYGSLIGHYYAWSTWADMYRYFMDAIYTSHVRELGPAAQMGMTTFITAYGSSAPVSRLYAQTFELFGDPSMKLPLPPPPNYLILTPPDFVNTTALNSLISSRQNRGFNVMTHTVASGTTNTALKSYVRSLWGTANSPKYVVIIGDTAGSTSTSNTIPHFVGLGYRQGTTDWPYVCMDTGDDWYPEIPIGRLSVQNAAQLLAVVDKTVKVESGVYSDFNYVKRATFLANSSSDVSPLAQATHNWVVDTYLTPNGYTATKVYGALGGTTAQVTAAVNAGSLFTVYMGHSADTGWWNPAFYQSDINALSNNGLYGVAMGWSCHTAQYELSECSGETWLRAANKGAAVYISASQYIYWGSDANWAPSVACEKAFFASVFEDDNWEIGPAWLHGMYRFLKDYGNWDGMQGHVPPLNADKCRDFMEEFVILGDPALKLPQPNGFTIEASPASLQTCSPPTNQVGFNLQIGVMGTFHEIVTLNVTGVPAGATVAFSNNQQFPPFSSVMTISNLSGVTPNQYSLVVHGVSVTKQWNTGVSLAVSNSTPTSPTLATPVSGSTNVARQPTLTWERVSAAIDYILEIATDPGFGQIVYTKTVAVDSHTVETELSSATTYYWHVRARNGCGLSAFSTYFNFTTISQANYYTQQFSGSAGDAFDLSNFSMRFIPDGLGSYYRMCGDAGTSLPSDPAGGTTFTVTEDGYAQIVPGRTISLYGQNYTSFYVNDNGNITFNSSDSTWTQTLTAHFSKPRIAALFDDLKGPSGTRSWKAFSDRIAVTFFEVAEYNTTNKNTFQIEMFNNGEIRITWLAIASANPIVGLSKGLGIPADFTPTNLSAAASCIIRGGCCIGQTCSILTQAQCISAGGDYQGDLTTCTPNPCIDYNEACVIISEVVDATLSGGCPKFIEITNTAAIDFVFIEGGIVIQHGIETDTDVDVNLTGVYIPAGQSIVVNFDESGTCTGAFQGAYGFAADVNTQVAFGNGGDRFMLAQRDDGSGVIDIYGEFGVNGVGREWECTRGYAYRLPTHSSGRGEYFRPAEWHFGGKDSLNGPNPEQLLATKTTPGTHTFNGPCVGADDRGDMDCDYYVTGGDIQLFITAVLTPGQFTGCELQRADMNGDSLINANDCQPFVQMLLGM